VLFLTQLQNSDKNENIVIGDQQWPSSNILFTEVVGPRLHVQVLKLQFMRNNTNIHITTLNIF